MDKYDKLMQDLIEFLKDTRLGGWHGQLGLKDRGPIRGSTDTEIEAVEQEIGKQLPAALRAWYRVAGSVPPYLYDYDADFSLEDLREAQTTAVSLTRYEPCEMKLASHILPFSQRIQDQFLFVNMQEGNPDDPPVYQYAGCGGGDPRYVLIAFTAFIRDNWLAWLDFPLVDKEISGTLSARPGSTQTWTERKKSWNELYEEARTFRENLIDLVHREDLQRDAITGPRLFQERWIQEFSKSDIWTKLQAEGFRMPFGWIDPPKT